MVKLTPAVVAQLLPAGQTLESAQRLDASNNDITEASLPPCMVSAIPTSVQLRSACPGSLPAAATASEIT